MAEKYYAVRKGRHPGVYTAWDACRAEVEGFSGAEYKSFRSYGEAKAYADGEEADMFADGDDVLAEAFVDGSFNAETGVYGWGAVINFGGEVFEMSGASAEPVLASMRNVAGEITGSVEAIRFAVAHGAETLVIYHDYEGIAKWCTGEWKANKEGTIAYKAFYERMKDRLAIRFVKSKDTRATAAMTVRTPWPNRQRGSEKARKRGAERSLFFLPIICYNHSRNKRNVSAARSKKQGGQKHE